MAAGKDWFIGRTIQAFVTMIAIITFSFFLIRVIPGGPEDALRERLERQGYPPEEIENRVELYLGFRPDKPLWQQYIDYVVQLANGNLGQSIRFQQSVAEILASAMPWTLFISINAMLFTFTVGISLGAIMAYYEGSRLDVGLTSYSTLMSSIPYYVTAILGLYILSYQMDIFPTGSRYPSGIEPTPTLGFMFGAVEHAALPILSMVLGGGLASLGMRGNAIRVLGEDFMRVAEIRGLPDRRISIRYVLHNAVLPMYTGLMLSIAFMFDGSVILERIFSYPGMGWYTLEAVIARDYPLMMGGLLIITFGIVVAMFIADMTYGFIDPRASVGGESGEKTYAGRTLNLNRLVTAIKRFVGRGSSADVDLDLSPARSSASGDSKFETVASTSLSRQERLKRALDNYVLTTFRIIWDDRRTKFAISILVFFIGMAVIGTRLLPEPSLSMYPRMVPPFQNMQYPLGTDGMGQGILGAIVHSSPTMLKIIFSGALFSTFVGTAVGTLAGYSGGVIDRVLSSAADIMMTIPALPLIMILAAIFSPSNPFLLGLILSVNSWAGFARAVRSQVLSLREENYVEASRALGLSTNDIIVGDIVPGIAPYVAIHLAGSARGIIFNSVGLYFLGVLPYSTTNWGLMLNQAYSRGGLYTLDAVHWFFWPMLTIILISFGFILLAQGFDRLFNPRVRARHADTEAPAGEEEVVGADAAEGAMTAR